MDMIKTLAAELQQNEQYVANVVKLLDEGNTVPFIARYRKEMHGTMDDQTIRVLAERLAYLRGLETRKAEIRDAIDAQGKLTPELTAAIENAATLSALDDIYRPYRPKRRTRASMAREKGLEPLADAILSARNASPSLEALAQPYVSEEKGVSGTDAALAGASDIIAENLSADCVTSFKKPALSARRPTTRTIPPTPCTTTFPSRCAECRATASSHSTAVKKRASSR